MSLLNPIARWALLAGALALVAASLYATGYRHGAAAVQARWDAAQLATTTAARAAEAAAAHKVKEAQDALEIRKTALAADLAALRAQLERVRRDRDALRTRIAELSAPAARHLARTAVDVFDECAEQYSELAAAADQCAAERQALAEAWPK